MIASLPDCQLDHALHEDFHDASADLVVALRRFRQVHDHQLRAAALVRIHGLLPDLCFATAAADGAAEAAVGPHRHLRARPPPGRGGSGP